MCAYNIFFSSALYCMSHAIIVFSRRSTYMEVNRSAGKKNTADYTFALVLLLYTVKNLTHNKTYCTYYIL